MKRSIVLLWLCALSFFTGFSQQTYPHLQEFCTDLAGIFSETELLSLRQKLAGFEAETSHQIVVLTVQNLGDESIENYALEVFEQNKIGQLDSDNGLLILFSEEDREVRIEVGYGLELMITDAISSRLIRNIMIPEFKEYRYFEGIDLVTDDIIKIITDPIYAEEFEVYEEGVKIMPFWGKLIIVILVGGFLSVFFWIGSHILKKSYQDLVTAYRGLISGEIGVLYFPFLLVGILFSMIFGVVFSVVPLFVFTMMLSVIIFNLNMDGVMDAIFDSAYINGFNILLVMGFLLIGLPMLIATTILKRYDTGFKLSFLKTNSSFIERNISLYKGTSSSRTSRSSRSSWSSKSSKSSRSSSRSFSGGGGRSGGGGASGRW